jgi:diadenosine tetraphosphate (Ap4A) HIT family hydrolase
VTDITAMPLFPYRGEMELKALEPLMPAELPRDGEGGRPCHRCTNPDEGVIWSNARWLVSAGAASARPVTVFLETREHVDLEHLADEMAAELGVLIVRVEAAVRAIPDVGRVHVHRWSDGSSHFHFWFMARPARQIEFYGWGNVLWPQVLAPIDDDVHARNLGIVRRELERTAGG